MRQAFFSYLFVCLCALNPLFAASNADAAQEKLVTPTAQAEKPEGVRLAAPSNARPPVDIDTSDLKPTLFRPLVALLEQIQARQEEALETLEDVAKQRQSDRTDEVLTAIRGINERKVEIKGWNENKEALEGLTGLLGRFRDRLERVATVEDVQEAVEGIQIPVQEFPEVDLTGLAQEETLLAFGDRLPTIQNIREIGDNVASLTARLDNIAAQVEEIDVNGEIATLKKQLQITILLTGIIVAIVFVILAIELFKWLAKLTAKSRENAAEIARTLAWAREQANKEQNKSAA